MPCVYRRRGQKRCKQQRLNEIRKGQKALDLVQCIFAIWKIYCQNHTFTSGLPMYVNQGAYIIEGGVEYVFSPPLLSDLICKIVRPIFQKKPGAGEKILRSFFFKKLTFLAVLNGFLAVFSASTTKKARRRRKIWEPLFLRAGGARKIFRPDFHFRPT